MHRDIITSIESKALLVGFCRDLILTLATYKALVLFVLFTLPINHGTPVIEV
jgi:hypothetical protein